MIYWLDIHFIGHLVDNKDAINDTIQIDTHYDGNIVMLTSSLLGVPKRCDTELLILKCQLSEKTSIKFLPNLGGPQIQHIDLDLIRVFSLKQFGPKLEIGLYKGRVFCRQGCLEILLKMSRTINYHPVLNGDMRSFIWNGMDLGGASPRIREFLLKARHENWDQIE